ncbi:hypothetical protein ACIP88_33495 [Streptomyces uncialis]|uniref:hypothetical protein n=1 Tax=Streptomyces uncialis TaxID=1048205 RepID=UPI0038017EA4
MNHPTILPPEGSGPADSSRVLPGGAECLTRGLLRKDQHRMRQVIMASQTAPAAVARNLTALADIAARWAPCAVHLAAVAPAPTDRERWLRFAALAAPGPRTGQGREYADVVYLANAVREFLHALGTEVTDGPAVTRLTDRLRAACARGDDGDHPPGFRVPVNALARTHKEPLHLVRRAVDRLIDEGILEQRGPLVRTRGSHALDSARAAHVAHRIHRQITAGVHPAGRPLPPDRVLAAHFVVGTDVTRDAVHALQHRHIISTDRTPQPPPAPPSPPPAPASPAPPACTTGDIQQGGGAGPFSAVPGLAAAARDAIGDWRYRKPVTRAQAEQRWALFLAMSRPLLGTDRSRPGPSQQAARVREAAGLPLPDERWWAVWHTAVLATALLDLRTALSVQEPRT